MLRIKMFQLEVFIIKRIFSGGRKSFSSFIMRIAIVAVVLSLSTMIIATSMINGFQKEIRNKVLGFWSPLQVLPYTLNKSLQETGIYKYQDFYAKPDLLPGVVHVQSVAYKGTLLRTKDGFEGVALKGVDSDYNWENIRRYMKKGGIVQNSDSASTYALVISSFTAKRLQIDTGSKVIASFIGNSIRNRVFKVVGVFETGLEEFDRKYAICPIEVIQELNGWGTDTVGGFELQLEEKDLFQSRWQKMQMAIVSPFTGAEEYHDPIDKIAAEVYYGIGNSQLDVQSVKDVSPGIFDWLELQTTNEAIITVLMICVAAINMITMLLILILERTTMIGILKSLGTSNALVRQLFSFYSLIIIGIGVFAGDVLGLLICWLQYNFHIVKLPQESYYLEYAPIDFNLFWIIGLNIGTVLICLLMLSIPSLLVNRISPVKAIRFK